MTNFLNMYNMNMFGNSCFGGNNWGGLIQSGLGLLFGGNSFGYGPNMFGGSIFNNNMFGGNMFGGNIFTDCHGQVNYDAMAGFGVANALVGVASYAIAQNKAEKATEKAAAAKELSQNEETLKSNQKRIDEIDEILSDSTLLEKEISSEYQTNIDNATTKRDTVDKQLTDKRDMIAKLEGQSNADQSDTTIKEQLEKAKEEYQNLKKEFDKLNSNESTKGSIKYYEKLKEDAIQAKKEALQREKAKLEADNKKLVDTIRNAKLDNSIGHKKMNEADYNALFDKQGKLKSDADVNKKAINTAGVQFQNATNDEEKRDAAQKFKQLWNVYSINNTPSTTEYRMKDIIYDYLRDQ